VVQDTANELGVPCISWTGAHRFASEYCFTVANGDIPTEGVMCAQWLAAKGLKRIGSFWEQGSSGRDYADFFRDAATQLGLTVVREVKLEPNPRGLKEELALMRDLGVEGLYYGGYGYATFHFAEAFKALDWDPPRIMGTAFMFYSNSNRWAEGLEGWHGIDQLGEDGANPNYNAMVERFEKRFGRSTRNVVVALAYDTARVAVHGIANASIPAPEQVKEGIERIRWMPEIGSASCRGRGEAAGGGGQAEDGIRDFHVTGVQTCALPICANPNYNAMVERFEKRFGRSTRNVVVALAYDTARVAVHGIANASIPAPEQVKEGIERIRWMP